VAVRDPAEGLDEDLQPDRGPGRVAPALLVGRQTLLEVGVDVRSPELTGPGQLGKGLLQGLRWAVGDVEHLQRPGPRDRRHVGHGTGELPELDHDRVAAGERCRGVGQRAGPHRDVGEQISDGVGQIVDVLAPAAHDGHPSGTS